MWDWFSENFQFGSIPDAVKGFYFGQVEYCEVPFTIATLLSFPYQLFLVPLAATYSLIVCLSWKESVIFLSSIIAACNYIFRSLRNQYPCFNTCNCQRSTSVKTICFSQGFKQLKSSSKMTQGNIFIPASAGNGWKVYSWRIITSTDGSGNLAFGYIIFFRISLIFVFIFKQFSIHF